MSEASLRGTRLGATSYERTDYVVLAERESVAYECLRGHEFSIEFSTEAEEIPGTWECRCGEPAHRLGEVHEEPAPIKVGRSHWDMLRERRSMAELEQLLAERMLLLNGESELRQSA